MTIGGSGAEDVVGPANRRRIARRRVAGRAAGLLAVLLVGACAGPTNPPTDQPPERGSSDRPFAVFVYDVGGMSREALLSGVLELTDGCLTVRSESGDSFNLVLSDTTVWEDGALQWGDERLRPGDAIALGGGEFNSARALSEHGLPTTCDTGNPAWKTQ